MWRSWRLHLVVISVAACWLSLAFVVVPRLGNPVSFNQVSNSQASNTGSPDGTEASQASNQATSRSFRGNVYHIILDSYQSEAYPYFLAQTPELNQLPFTYYPNFHSNSSLTYFSMAEMFASDFYTPGMSPENWYTAAIQNGVMDYLAKSGVQLHLYPYWREQCYGGGSAVCKTTVDLKRELLGDGRARQMAVDLWFLKLIPTSLKRQLDAWFAPPGEGASDSNGFSNWDYGFSVSNVVAPSKLPGDSDNPYFTVQQFMRLLDDEDARPATGQYVFAHVILPHGPFELDRECNYVGRRTAQGQSAQALYLEQVQCAHKLLALLVSKLESLGRLDNSLIIVHADHGFYWHPADLGILHQYKPLDVSVARVDHDSAGTGPTWPSEVIETKSSALMLIKFPGQSAASRSDKPVQMIDIAPTILRYFDIDPGSMHGISIQDMPASPDRERFFASNFLPDGRDPEVFSMFRYADGKWKFDEDVVILKSTDLLFTLGATR